MRRLGVLALHVVLLAAWLVQGTHQALQREVEPLSVTLAGEAERQPAPYKPRLRSAPIQAPRPVPDEVPQVVVADGSPARLASGPPAPPQPAAKALASVLTPAPAQPPRRQVTSGAVQYLVLPPVELPRASRRARESGTVWLRVIVDVQRMPAQVSVQRSSGFARLDEQALWAMRQARFKPQTEDGRPIELEVVAPIEYPAT